MKKKGINLEKVWNKLLDIVVPPEPEIKEEKISEEKDQNYTAYLQGWVSRDKNSRRLALHCRPPMNFKLFKEYGKGIVCLPKNHFPNLEYDDGPIKVTIILKYEKDSNKGMDS